MVMVAGETALQVGVAEFPHRTGLPEDSPFVGVGEEGHQAERLVAPAGQPETGDAQASPCRGEPEPESDHEPVRESDRESTRESARESACEPEREPDRESARESAREPTGTILD